MTRSHVPGALFLMLLLLLLLCGLKQYDLMFQSICLYNTYDILCQFPQVLWALNRKTLIQEFLDTQSDSYLVA